MVLPQMYLEAGAIRAAPERGPEVAMPVVTTMRKFPSVVSYRKADVPVVHIVEHIEDRVVSDMTRVKGASPDRLSCVCAAEHGGAHLGVVSIETYTSENCSLPFLSCEAGTCFL